MITLSRVGSSRAGRHGDRDAHSQAFDIDGGVVRGGGAAASAQMPTMGAGGPRGAAYHTARFSR